jgi:hypothetical protein
VWTTLDLQMINQKVQTDHENEQVVNQQ